MKISIFSKEINTSIFLFQINSFFFFTFYSIHQRILEKKSKTLFTPKIKQLKKKNEKKSGFV